MRAVVMGAGWAGQGYVQALRNAGVEVVALCGRSPVPARAVGEQLGIGDVRIDWRSAVEDLRPDIVVVATPAATHREMTECAAQRGAHVVCEKPLGRNADEGRRMLDAVVTAGVKHAYGPTSRYGLGLAEARALLAGGAIGEVQQIELVDHLGMPPLLPYCWIHSLDLGGGLLANGYTHFLAQIQYLTGGTARWATGLTSRVLDRVPVGAPLHDFRQWEPLTAEQAAAADWRENDADLAAMVTTHLELGTGRSIPARFDVSACTTSPDPGRLTIYGDDGTLRLEGQPWYHRMQRCAPGDPVGEEIAFDQVDDPIQLGWNRLIEDVVADVRGEQPPPYPTFHDGYAATVLIDQIRAAHPSNA